MAYDEVRLVKDDVLPGGSESFPFTNGETGIFTSEGWESKWDGVGETIVEPAI